MVEHSCFHTTFGPFVSVPGTPGQVPTDATPDVDAVHTEYRVGLPISGEAHVVTYSPERSGNWVVFTSSDVQLEVIDEADVSLKLVFEQHGETGCDALPIGRVFTLRANERYTLRLGPALATSEMLVIEYADDFLIRVGRDADADGFGSTVDAYVTNCTPPSGFAPNTSDCDDANPRVNPHAIEHCDDIDENCNGSPDDVGLSCRTGTGGCAAAGQFTCSDETATCDATAVEPKDESCNGVDDDCDGAIDDGGDSLCEQAHKPRCVRRDLAAFCGCTLDVDCGQVDSGRICNLVSNACEDGCSTTEGGNGCPTGETCETEGGVNVGLCVPDEPDVPNDVQVEQRGIGTVTTPGCQCVSAPQPHSRAATVVSFGLIALAWARRRGVQSLRRGAKLCMFSSSLVSMGCGGRTIDDEPHALLPESSCASQIGSKPISHACTHTTNGPFENVVAAASPDDAPNVDAIHVSYLIEPAEEASDSFVHFTPSRDGEHLMLLDEQVPLTVSKGTQLERPVFEGALTGCSTASFGQVYDLSAGERHTITLSASKRAPTLLFFEHLATFGKGAWQESCLEDE